MAVEFEHDGMYENWGKYRVSKQLFLDLIFNNACNCACQFCIAKTKDYAEVDFERWKKNLKRTFEIFKVKDVIILGGEATIDRRFFEKLDILADAIKGSEVDNVILTTNGIMLKSDSFLDRVVKSCISAVNISIMNYDKGRNDEIFRANTLDKARLVQIYSALKKENKGMRINCNVYRGNCSTTEEMKNFVKHFSGLADAIKFSPLMATDMFDTCNEVTDYTNKYSLTKDEIFDLYDNFAKNCEIIDENDNVFGLVPYKKLRLFNQDIILKYQQIEDQYDLDRVIPTLKLYPNGNLSNEWNYKKDILADE